MSEFAEHLKNDRTGSKRYRKMRTLDRTFRCYVGDHDDCDCSNNGIEPYENCRCGCHRGQIGARHGFHGYVTHPMNFLAGEHGRERVDIHKAKGRGNNDFWNVSRFFGGRF
jgi:hypothetical protein